MDETPPAGLAPGSVPLVLTEQHGPVGLVVLNRPDRNNAWTDELGEALFDALRACDDDPEVRAIVLTGAGKSYCVGGDTATLENAAAEGTLHFDRVKRTPLWTTTTLRKPVIAAINGGCAGIGLVQALMCDIRFAAAGARFSCAYARRGLPAEQGLSWVLPRLIGVANSLDLLLSARTFGAAEAMRRGVVSHVVGADEDVVSYALAYAAELCEHCSPFSMFSIKQQVWSDLNGTLLEAAKRADQLTEQAVGAADFAESLESWRTGRPPRFAPLEGPR